MTSKLEDIIANGNAYEDRGEDKSSLIACVDGFTISVLAHNNAYCTPRVDRGGPYTAVECGYPSTVPEPWLEWFEYRDGGCWGTFAYVPVEMVRELIASHGGEVQS
jgi:hypothetical protein